MTNSYIPPDSSLVTLRIPTHVYADLQKLVGTQYPTPTDVITHLVSTKLRHQAWLQEVQTLRDQIRADGGLTVSDDDDELIEQLRTIRSEIFEQEYAHMYR